MTTAPTSTVRSLIEEELPSLIEIRRDLHRHPELGYQEQRTSGVVRRELDAAGIEHVDDLAGGTGVLGHLPGAESEAIGLRADMDALPIIETTGVEYTSANAGVMHACGHDGHTTMLIGAARVLARLSADGGLPRPVTFVFQPAEEGGGGGKRMVEDGCLDGSVLGPPVATMFGQHGWPRLPLGVVGSRAGAFLAAADMFDIKVVGTGAHAAFPHLGHDPIVAAGAIVTALQSIASRNTDPLDAIVVSTTQIHAGTTHNIIPDDVVMSGTVRTLRTETQQMAIERIKAIADGVARAHGCRAEVDYQIAYPVTLNDAGAVDTFRETATETLGEPRVVDVPQPFMGAEDFSFYCHKVPSCVFILGLLAPGQEAMPDLHQPTFDFNDDALATGIEMFVNLALRRTE